MLESWNVKCLAGVRMGKSKGENKDRANRDAVEYRRSSLHQGKEQILNWVIFEDREPVGLAEDRNTVLRH